MINLIFNSFDDFISKKDNIKEYYTLLDYAKKRQYKRYIYSLNYRVGIRDGIWCFLNEPAGECLYEMELMEMYRIYKKNYKVENGRNKN